MTESQHFTSAGTIGGMTTDQFIATYKTDPYAALITRMMLDGWAMGYEAARRDVEAMAADEQGWIKPDHPLAPACHRLRSASYSTLRNRAADELASRAQEAEQQAILALAVIGRENPDLPTRFRS